MLKGSFANTTVIALFIWNVDMQLLYIKLSALIYAALLNFQLVAVFSVSAITQIRHCCIEPMLILHVRISVLSIITTERLCGVYDYVT